MRRLVDANDNRAAEGLRVLEDIVRFLRSDPELTAVAKALRHELRRAVDPGAVTRRDTPGDPGTSLRAADEDERRTLVDLVRANAARVGESLRVLEEAAKLAGGEPARFESLRYRLYDLESRLLAGLPAWRLRGVGLYLLVDPVLCDDPPAVAAAAERGGAGVVQLRAKGLSPPAYRELALRVRDALRGEALFAVNDHAALVPGLAAPLLHLGQEDLPLPDARLAVGAGVAIGSSVHSPGQLAAAQAAGADYVGIGPMFATATKPSEPARGPELLDAVAGELRVPSYAIGGLDEERVRGLLPRLPHGVAVSAAVCRSPDPEGLCRRLAEMLARDGSTHR